MKRDFLSNIILLVGINLIVKPIYIFGIDRNVQNVVGFEQYGLYTEILSFSLIFYILNDFGIQNFTSRTIAQHGQLLDKYFPNLLSLKVLSSLLYLAVALLAGWYMDYARLHFWLLFVLLFNQIIISFVQFFRANIIGLGQYRTDSLLSVLDRFLMIIICGILLFTPRFRSNFQIDWFVYAHTFSMSITLIIAFLLLRKHLHLLKFHFNWKLLLVLLKQSFPYALIVLLMTIYHRTDAIMIGKLYPNGTHEVGIYAAAYRLLEAAMMFALLFGNLLLPMFSKLIKAKERVDNLVQLSFQLLMAGAITLGIALICCRNEIMDLLYTNQASYSGDVLGLLMLGFIAVSGTYIWGSLIIATGDLRRLNMIYLGGIFINITLNFLVIPTHGAIGAGFTTAITQAAVLVAEIGLGYYLLRPKIATSLLRLLVFSSLLCGVAYGMQQYELDWGIAFGLQLLAGAIFAFLIGLIQVKALKELVA